jgi:hypothetical protein
MRAGALAVASCLAISCGPSGPTVLLQVVPSAQIENLSRFDRLTLEASRCDQPAGERPVSLEVPLQPDPGQPSFELPIPPGAPFSLWLQAFEGPLATADACSEWLVLDEGELRVPLTLSSTSGLCPTPRDRCP